MTKKQNSLLDTTRKSLNDEQITSCFDQFKEAVYQFKDLPQVEFKERSEDNTRSSIKFVSISDSHAINSPSLSIDIVESCQNMEQVKAIKAMAHNCGICHGGATVQINNKNLSKFEVILENMKKIFSENYERVAVEDKKQVELAKVQKTLENLLNDRWTKNKNGAHDQHFIGTVHGSLYTDVYEKSFDVTLKDLTEDQVRKLAPIINSL